MSEIDFIKSNLEEIQLSHPSLSFKCGYDESSSMYIVEVKPLQYYESNEQYIDFESNLSFKFDNEFYPNSILFVSDDSTIKVENSLFELESQIEKETVFLLDDLLEGKLNTFEIVRLLSDNDNKSIESFNYEFQSSCFPEMDDNPKFEDFALAA